MANNSVLLALTDLPTLTVISYHLERFGFIVSKANNAEMILETMARIESNILLLDEDISGNIKSNELCAILKQKYNNKLKIILVSKAAALERNNIDDSIIKPFIPSELVKKIKNFSTSNKKEANNHKIIRYQDIEMNVNTFRITKQGKVVHLGPNEFKIFQCFLEFPGKTLSREHIMNYVWGDNHQIEIRTIDVHINRLRAALQDENSKQPLIKTIRSEGYTLNKVLETV